MISSAAKLHGLSEPEAQADSTAQTSATTA
jgi:hypothetical protein